MLAGSFASPDRLQYDSHCRHHAVKSVPLSTWRSSFGKSCLNVLACSAIVSLEERIQQKTVRRNKHSTLSGACNRHQGIRTCMSTTYTPCSTLLLNNARYSYACLYHHTCMYNHITYFLQMPCARTSANWFLLCCR